MRRSAVRCAPIFESGIRLFSEDLLGRSAGPPAYDPYVYMYQNMFKSPNTSLIMEYNLD